ncbi:MAG: hypothetical protein WCX22_05975 [Methanoregula sp.]
MMSDGVAGGSREAGLSEVIGFVLILGLLVIVASLYLAYGIPAQGRENEILHMNAIKDQFVAFKLSLDSLFTNDKVGTTLSNSFTLGTSGGYTEGMLSFIPIMSPVNSGGTIAINQRTTTPETLSISSRSLILNTTYRTSVDLPAQVNYTPSHVYVNISGIQSSDLSASKRFGATVNTSSWAVYVNLTPETSFYQWYQTYDPTSSNNCLASPRNQNGTPIFISNTICLVPMNAYAFNGTDLSISVNRGGIITMENYPVYRNVRAGSTYTIDLMDPAYGISSSIQTADGISIKTDMPLGSINATGNISYGFTESNPYTISPIPLGAVEFRAQNSYWIAQDYYYQMGGVFLSQNDGNTTYKLPPEITFSYDNVSGTDPTRKIVTVNINALVIDPDNRGVVGGNSPVQMKTQMTNVTQFPYATGKANTKWIRIAVNTSDSQAREMWKNYFDYSATVNNIPHFTVGEDGTEVFIRINGYYDDTVTASSVYDINVIASEATYSTSIHGIGGTLE